MNVSSRRTKIVCTIGPSTDTPEKIEELVRYGMNVARINFSHGSHDDHLKVIHHLRKVEEKMGTSLPILMDLQGPKIRVGKLQDDGVILESGDLVDIVPDDIVGTSKTIPIDYPNLVDDAVEGDLILMDDGLLELRVKKKQDDKLVAKVIIGGKLKPRKGVNLPGVKISAPSLTSKDREDLLFGLEHDVDMVAMSFVRSPEDIQDLISIVRARGSHASIIAKIEKPEAVDVIDEILEESDGIMIARGDLGIEIASERVPLIQKSIIDKCRLSGKPVITATQMLDSMMGNPRATRAESSDVANAVLDGTDAVMLSGETAAGEYPIDAVKVMDKICKTIESNAENIYNSLSYRKPEWKEKQIIESLAYSCVRISDYVDAKAISTLTHSGSTARRVAKFRPIVPIIAFTESPKIRRQLNLVWGVTSIQVDQIFDTDQSVSMMEQYLKDNHYVEEGDRVIIATGIPLAKRGRTNMLKVSSIE